MSDLKLRLGAHAGHRAVRIIEVSLDTWCEDSMSSDKVVPFRKRPPSEAQLQMYRRITQNWHPAMRQLVLPDLFRRDKGDAKG